MSELKQDDENNEREESEHYEKQCNDFDYFCESLATYDKAVSALEDLKRVCAPFEHEFKDVLDRALDEI